MPEFCPLCSKRGFKRKIIALQINFHEALWACEGEQCEWPFGYEDFIIVQREVGNTWSYCWEDFKPSVQAMNDCVSVSTELSLYTPPETPSAEPFAKDSLSDTQSSNDCATANTINNSITATEAQFKNIVHVSDHDAYCLSDTVESANNKTKNLNRHVSDNTILNSVNHEQDQTSDLSFHENNEKKPCNENMQSIIDIENISENICIETEDIESKETSSILETNHNTDMSDNNSDINVSNKNLIEKSKDITNTSNTNKSYNNAEIPNSTLDSTVQGNNFANRTTRPSNLQVTTVVVDGLPITLSYEASTSPVMAVTVTDKKRNPITTQCATTSLSTNTNSSIVLSNTTHKLNSKQSKNILASKQYEKFSFNTIKKKAQPSVKDIVTAHVKKKNLSKVITPHSTININKTVKAEVANNEMSTSEHVTVDTSLDILLNDFIKHEEASSKVHEKCILPDCDDDWINSLLH